MSFIVEHVVQNCAGRISAMVEIMFQLPLWFLRFYSKLSTWITKSKSIIVVLSTCMQLIHSEGVSFCCWCTQLIELLLLYGSCTWHFGCYCSMLTAVFSLSHTTIEGEREEEAAKLISVITSAENIRFSVCDFSRFRKFWNFWTKLSRNCEIPCALCP